MAKKTSKKPVLTVPTGIPGIDDQHNTLFILCRDLLAALEKNKASTDSSAADLKVIIENLKTHITTEENLLVMIGFPGLEDHKSRHNKLLVQLKELQKSLKTRDVSESSRMFKDFYDDMQTHLSVYDQEYTVHIEKLLSLRKKFNISALTARILVE